MKIKTSELTDAALDWAVAKCEGYELRKVSGKGASQFDGYYIPLQHGGHSEVILNSPATRRELASCDGNPFFASQRYWSPSTNWAQGGPVIERKKITLSFNHDFQIWEANIVNKAGDDFFVGHGPTPLIAAMRCYVASELGDEIDIPDELQGA